MQGDQDAPETKRVVLALDVGATFVKSGIVEPSGACRELAPVAIESSGAAAEILDALAAVLRMGMRAAGPTLAGLGVCIPGPFDYARGVSLMTHKYASLHGLDLGAALRKAVPALDGLPVWFRHDVHAFLVGERWRGQLRGLDSAVGVMLGTGIGVACCRGGELLANELGAPAADVSVWRTRYRDATVEDYVSSRALLQRYRRMVPDYDPASGVKGIADAARQGDASACRVFEELGADLGRVLAPVCEAHRPDRIVFGGQVSKAFPWFREALVAAMPYPACIPCALGDTAGLVGNAALHFMPTLWKESPAQNADERKQP